jgi:hypothetical protein
MSSRLLVAALAVSLLSFTCIAKSPDIERITEPTSAPPLAALSEAALEEESASPITCGAALRLAEQHGYQEVEVQNCFGSEYAFRAIKDGLGIIVLVDPENGRLWQGKILR